MFKNFLGGEKMHKTNNSIQCSVENCKYYSNNYCTAKQIKVDNQYGSLSNSSEETICVTFEPKK